MAAMRGSSIPADDFGPSTGAANDFGGKNSGIMTYDDLKHSGVDDIDPEMDPELAMALRMSLEEERARQERVSFRLKYSLCRTHSYHGFIANGIVVNPLIIEIQ